LEILKEEEEMLKNDGTTQHPVKLEDIPQIRRCAGYLADPF
jgi:hypothetical protein